MKKNAIVYASTHHGNTKKLVEEIADCYDVALIDAEQVRHVDLSEYDIIGFASGIDFGKFYPSVERFLQENLPKGKKVFFLYTCAKVNKGFTKTMQVEALKKDAVLLGEYGCRGYNTYGPWKLIGGMNKRHPDRKELEGAVRFYRTLLENQK